MKKRKKIGLDGRMYGTSFTGIGRLVYELVNQLPKLMTDFEFVVFLNKKAYENFENISENVELVLADEKIYSFCEQTSFLKKIKKEKCDLMHFLHFNLPFFYRGKFTTTIHDLTLFDFPGQKMNKWHHRLAFHLIFKHAVKRSKKIVTVSDYTKNELVKRMRIDKKKIQTIYNAINEKFLNIKESKEEAFEIISDKFKIKENFFLYTGVWREHKNLLNLLKAFLKLKNEGLQANLVLTGRANNPAVLNFINDNNLEKDVIYPGLVTDQDLKLLFRAAHVFVFPSLAEGFGIPPLEAMAAGCPVASSDTTSLPEVCAEAALFFDPHDVDDMSVKMKEVFINDNLRRDLILKGERQVAKFDWGISVKKTADFLKSCF